MALLLASPCFLASDARAEKPWQTLGLMRVRDMTPFGLNRLDMLPTHAVAAAPGTFGLQWSYRGTAMRFGITENLGNFNNTPDVGVNLAIGRVFGRVR